MTAIKKSDLHYTDYSWEAVPGDNPEKVSADRDRISRHEGYEVIKFINSFRYAKDNKELKLEDQLIIEWILHEKLPSNIQSKQKAFQWIKNNYNELEEEYEKKN